MGHGEQALLLRRPVGRPEHVQHLAVAVAVAVAEGAGRSPGHDGGGLRLGLRLIFGQHQFQVAATDQLFGLIAEQLLAGRADLAKAAFGIYRTQHVEGELHDALVEFLRARLPGQAELQLVVEARQALRAFVG
ncbi:hypothetical protein D9M70_470540 [compost metagenome]